VWNLSEKLSEESDSRDLERLLHKTIKKVSVDIENLAFNTAVSAMMILVNAWTVEKGVNRDNFKKFVLLLAPFAPHLAEELWQVLGETGSVFKQAWPEYNQELARDERVKLVVQINSKLRETLELAADMDEMAVKEAAMASEKVAKWLGGQEIVKVVFVKNRLINFVVK
jgi:leucyl-tRNA synthetase